MTVAIVSSVYGGYDQPIAPVPQDIPVDLVLVTDRPPADPASWKVILEPRPQLHPRLAAKVAKTRPDRYSDADVLIWVDASIRVEAADFAGWCLTHLHGAVLAQLRHPHRTAIVPEADVSQTMAKYGGLPVHEQVVSYLDAGFPDGYGLWATGVIAYRRGPWLGRFGDAWLAEQVRWTYQDQLSEPYVLWRHGLLPAELPGPLWGNPRFSIAGHRDDR